MTFCRIFECRVASRVMTSDFEKRASKPGCHQRLWFEKRHRLVHSPQPNWRSWNTKSALIFWAGGWDLSLRFQWPSKWDKLFLGDQMMKTDICLGSVPTKTASEMEGKMLEWMVSKVFPYANSFCKSSWSLWHSRFQHSNHHSFGGIFWPSKGLLSLKRALSLNLQGKDPNKSHEAITQ